MTSKVTCAESGTTRLATELRGCRRLEGISTMAEGTAHESTPAASTVVLTHPRDPGTFSGYGGSDEVDVEDWAADYERVSALNRWGPTLILANLIFYLKGTAKVWFEEHQAELGSWDICREKMLDLFGKPVGRRIAAMKAFASRAQSSAEA